MIRSKWIHGLRNYSLKKKEKNILFSIQPEEYMNQVNLSVIKNDKFQTTEAFEIVHLNYSMNK